MQTGGKECHCHPAMAIFLLLLGLLFLLNALGVFTASFTAIVWPILVILLGLKKLCKCK